MVVLDSKSITHAMVYACTKLLLDLSEYDLIHGSMSLYDDTRMAISARLQRTQSCQVEHVKFLES